MTFLGMQRVAIVLVAAWAPWLLAGCGLGAAPATGDGGGDVSPWRVADGPGAGGLDGAASAETAGADLVVDEVLPPSADAPGDAPSDAAPDAPAPVPVDDLSRFSDFVLPFAPDRFGFKSSNPGPIITGPDGNLWITDTYAFHRMTVAGVFTTFPVAEVPENVTIGPDGAIWFTTLRLSGGEGGNIGRLTVDGQAQFFPGKGDLFHSPGSLTTGPDGNLWFCDSDHIGRMTTGGVVTEFLLPTLNPYAWGINPGPDGNLWFGEQTSARVGRITPAGVITEFATSLVGAQAGQGANIGNVLPGPDGKLWFAEPNLGQIGNIDTTGNVSTLMFKGRPNGITFLLKGPDGRLWFAGPQADQFGRINPDGTVTVIQVPFFKSNFNVGAMASGPDGALWFTAPDATRTLGMPAKVVRYQP